jgi:hypothetical protein
MKVRDILGAFVLGALAAPFANAQQVVQQQIILQQPANMTFTVQQLPVTTQTITIKNNNPQLSVKVEPPSVKVTTLGVQVPAKSGPICGGVVNGVPQKDCGALPAKFESAAQGTCPQGTFFDIGKWQCWSCPAGYGRSIFAVDSDRACTKPDSSIRGKFGPATYRGPLCPAGSFHDPIRGGECYSCPSDFRRSILHVNSDQACHKPGREELFRATRHQKTSFAWDCKDGRFWDIWDGGNCWSCPGGRRTAHHINRADSCARDIREEYTRATLVTQAKCQPGEIHDLKIPGQQDTRTGGGCWTCPREPQAWDRTVFPVDGQQACELGGGYAISKGTFHSNLTCPAGQIFDFIGLNAGDIRDRPEMAGRNVQPVASGTCWSCPTGYDRTLAHVKSGNACGAKTIGWFTAPIKEPGLFGLLGAAEVLADVAKRHPALLKAAVEATAASAAKNGGGKSAAQFTQQEWQTLADRPHESTAAAAVVMARILAALASPSQASSAEKQAVESFKQYVIARRTFIATDALAQYDAWRTADEYARNRRAGQGPQSMTILLDYGTVPPDFNKLALYGSLGAGIASSAVGVAAGSLPVVGEVIGVVLGAAGNGFADFSDPGSAVKFLGRQALELAVGKAAEAAVSALAKSAAHKLTQDAIALGLVKGVPQAASRVLAAASSSGPQIIIGASIMILSIAIDQVEQIQNARPRLEASLATAKADPQLARLAVSDTGMTEMLTYLSFLIAGDVQMPTASRQILSASLENAKATQVAAAATSTQTLQKSASAAFNWVSVPGKANDIAVGANGSVWHIGTNVVPGGFGIYRWTGAGWSGVQGGAVKVAVDPQGNGWVLNDKNQIYRWDGGKFVVVEGAAKEIAIGANGTIWVLGTATRPGGYEVFRWTGSAWQSVPGGATRIAVDPQGNAWVANDRKEIFRWDGRSFVKMQGLANAIGIGANGTVWHLGTNEVAGGYGLWWWNNGQWSAAPGGLTELSVAPDGRVWGANASKDIFRMQ